MRVLCAYDLCRCLRIGWIDWQWLDAIRRAQRLGPLQTVDLEVGCLNGLLPASYECYDRLVAQVWGRRRVLLIDPGQVCVHSNAYSQTNSVTTDN